MARGFKYELGMLAAPRPAVARGGVSAELGLHSSTA